MENKIEKRIEIYAYTTQDFFTKLAETTYRVYCNGSFVADCNTLREVNLVKAGLTEGLLEYQYQIIYQKQK